MYQRRIGGGTLINIRWELTWVKLGRALPSITFSQFGQEAQTNNLSWELQIFVLYILILKSLSTVSSFEYTL